MEGALFAPDTLNGYFNDICDKADFAGEMREGIAVVSTDTVDAFLLSIVIFPMRGGELGSLAGLQAAG